MEKLEVKLENEQKKCMCTVLIVTYNHEEYIRLAVESVLEQNTQYSYKIHIFDDASTDSTVDIIRDYANRYPDIVIPFIAEHNRGAQENIWRAYQSVDTPYVAVLEGDDYWCDSEKLQLQIEALEANPDCSFCAHNTMYQNDNDVYRQREDGNIFVYNRNVRETGKYTAEDFIPLYGAGWINHVNSRVIRMSCVKMDELDYKEDFLYDNAQFFYLLQRGNEFFIQRVMSIYRMSMSGTFTSMQVQKKIREHGTRMIHINQSTNYVYERLIYRHLASFTRYWLALDDIEHEVVKDRGSLMTMINRYYKKIRYDLLLHHKLKKQAHKNIINLQNKIRGV